jgi:hypothetical protein
MRKDTPNLLSPEQPIAAATTSRPKPHNVLTHIAEPHRDDASIHEIAGESVDSQDSSRAQYDGPQE